MIEWTALMVVAALAGWFMGSMEGWMRERRAVADFGRRIHDGSMQAAMRKNEERLVDDYLRRNGGTRV